MFASHARRGFSIVELMIVISLLGLLISISVPSMQGYLRANRFDTQCDQLASDLALARSLSVAHGRILQFAGTAGGYTITDTVTGATVRQREFAAGVELTGEVQANFFPWGGADATILNVGDGCESRSLSILPTGIVEVGS